MSAFAAVAAAMATLAAGLYARRTVTETQRARVEAREAHGAQTAVMIKATAAAAEQHQAEMADRQKLADSEAPRPAARAARANLGAAAWHRQPRP